MSSDLGSDQKPVNPDEIPLEDIDRILEEDDPDFSKGLEDVRAASEESADVEIESIEIDESTLEAEGDDDSEVERQTWFHRFSAFKAVSQWRKKLRFNLKANVGAVVEWSKHRPKEYLGYALSRSKTVLKMALRVLGVFQSWPLQKKLGFFALIFIFAGGVTLLKWNLEGRWLPSIDKPLLKDYSEVADRTYDLKDPEWVPLFQALRQPEHRYLFDKVVVNLKRSEFDPDSNPMGLFEFYVELDSKDTAIEVKSRELELLDLLQRTVEGETYGSLSGEPGKQRLKNLIRQEINQVLNRGWVKDVYISHIVLKP